MAPSRLGAALTAALVSLACLGASLRNIAATRDLLHTLSTATEASTAAGNHAGGAAPRRNDVEREIDDFRRRIVEETVRYGADDETEFYDFIGSILNIMDENRVSVIRLDILELNNGESLLKIDGKGSITDILGGLAALGNLGILVFVDSLVISEDRDFHRFSAVLRPATVPENRDAEADGASGFVYLPGRAVVGNPPAWAERLFGCRSQQLSPTPALRSIEPIPTGNGKEPSPPEWIVYVGRFRTAKNSTAYALRDERDGRIRLLSCGETKMGWQLQEDGPGALIIQMDERQYHIEVPE